MIPLHPALVAAHAAADSRGEPGYIDPFSRLFVMTATGLRARGFCCGNGCRHCPYDAAEQARAGRPGSSRG